jgi:hypothetical protein
LDRLSQLYLASYKNCYSRKNGRPENIKNLAKPGPFLQTKIHDGPLAVYHSTDNVHHKNLFCPSHFCNIALYCTSVPPSQTAVIANRILDVNELQ